MYDCISVFHDHVVYILFKLRGIKNYLFFETVSFISTVSFYINLHTSKYNTLIIDTLVSCLFYVHHFRIDKVRGSGYWLFQIFRQQATKDRASGYMYLSCEY